MNFCNKQYRILKNQPQTHTNTRLMYMLAFTCCYSDDKKRGSWTFNGSLPPDIQSSLLQNRSMLSIDCDFSESIMSVAACRQAEEDEVHDDRRGSGGA